MGALFTVPVAHGELGRVRAVAALGAGAAGRAQPRHRARLQGAGLRPPTFLLTGNEAQGMPDFMAAECDLLVKIPMLGKADSLNAAVATAVMAYEVLAQGAGL
jgi:TrmH family RNA methyltransferase